MSSQNDLPAIVPKLAEFGGEAALNNLARGESFVVEIDDVDVHVSYTAGTTPTVFLSTPYAPRLKPQLRDAGYRDAPVAAPLSVLRPLAIELRAEGERERNAKLDRVTREVQLGDPDFDREVYIITPSDDDTVKRVLESSALREACRTLIADGFLEIIVDDERGEITTRRGLSASAKADAATVARAFATIATEVPLLESAGLRRNWSKLWIAVMAALIILAWSFLLVAFAIRPFASVLGGIMIGVVSGVCAGFVIGGALRGRSDSHILIRVVLLCAASIGSAVAAFLV